MDTTMKRITSLQSVANLAVAALMTQLASAQPPWAGTPPPLGEVRPGAHVKQDPAQPAGTLTPTGITPAQIQQFYGFNQLNGIDGTGQTIAIVDAYGDRYATVTATTNIVNHKPVITYTTNITDATQNDWTNFCNQFSLPTSGLTVVYPQGQGNVSTNWALETALDIQWAHAIAPGANVVLVVTRDNSWSNLFAAVDYAVSAGANIVSMSWGGGESSTELADDAHFKHPGVTFVASSGDAGEGIIYPAASPYVLSVGGTQLTNSNGVWSEATWSGSGGGISLYETMPAYQNGWQQFSTGNMRSVPDVCYQGGPNPGVSVYVTPYGGWIQVYGTSVGTPQWAALIALANCASTSGPIGSANPLLYAVAASGTYPPYINPAYFNDMTSGSNGSDPDDFAVVGYDYVTGLGSPVANNLVPALTNLLVTPDFYLSVSPVSATIPATGGMASYTVAITPIGFADTVNLSVTGLPAGANATFNPNPATNSSILTVTLGAGSATGSYPLTITGVDTSNSALTRSAAANLTVSSGPTTVSVASITYAVSGGNKHTPATLHVTVAVEDSLGKPVAGASVSIELYLNRSPYGSANGTTLSNGTVTFSDASAPLGTYTTTVSSVTASGLTWDGITPSNSYSKTQ
jgi:subtilase family serine protease